MSVAQKLFMLSLACLVSPGCGTTVNLLGSFLPMEGEKRFPMAYGGVQTDLAVVSEICSSSSSSSGHSLDGKSTLFLLALGGAEFGASLIADTLTLPLVYQIQCIQGRQGSADADDTRRYSRRDFIRMDPPPDQIQSESGPDVPAELLLPLSKLLELEMPRGQPEQSERSEPSGEDQPVTFDSAFVGRDPVKAGTRVFWFPDTASIDLKDPLGLTETQEPITNTNNVPGETISVPRLCEYPR
jgi:hypothetical protein